MDDGNKETETAGDPGMSMHEDHGNKEPYEGMLFESEKAARDFYDDYASRAGFITRVRSSRKSERDGSVISRTLGCRGGSHDRTQVTSGRQNVCSAMLLLKREKNEKWVIRKFIKGHNHPLVVQFQKDQNNHRTFDEKDKKIQELTAKLRAKKRLSTAYREQLLTFMKDIEDHSEHISKKVHSIYKELRNLEDGTEKFP